MADIKVSQLNDGAVDANSYLLESNTNVSYKVKASDIGTFVNASQAGYSLNTTANTIVGAINEVATASGTTYDNTLSGLSATEVQSAIDELGTYEKYSPTSTYGTFVFERFGLTKTVEVNGLSGLPLGAEQSLEFTLPSTFIPLNDSQQATFPIIEPNTGSALRMCIFSDGRVKIHNYSTTVSNYPNLRMTSVYI